MRTQARRTTWRNSCTFGAGLVACGQAGGGEGLLSAAAVLLLIDDGTTNTSRNFFGRFDKLDQDGGHRTGFSWGDGAGATANLDVHIGGLLKAYTAPPEADFSPNPRATVVTDGNGDVSTITFFADFGIVNIQQRGGGVRLACPLRDDIVIVVDRT